ncbi:hypothetical protein DVH05_017305 [Phytophthora capsici]|nr:hypothetical protein DVH05_017305 [Phytophthora capsici]
MASVDYSDGEKALLQRQVTDVSSTPNAFEGLQGFLVGQQMNVFVNRPTSQRAHERRVELVAVAVCSQPHACLHIEREEAAGLDAAVVCTAHAHSCQTAQVLVIAAQFALPVCFSALKC